MTKSLPDQALEEGARTNVREKVLPAMLFGPVACAVILRFLSETHHLSLHAGMFASFLLLLSLVVWMVLERWHRVGMWLSVLGYLALSFLASRWIHAEASPCLLAIPAGLASLLLGTGYGFAMALFASVVLVFGGQQLGLMATAPRVVALGAIWATQCLVWAATECTYETIGWLSSNYERTRNLLESARDERVLLKQTQEDLVQANLELARISERLEYMREVAEDAQHAKEEFVANVSHELRTPLNMIIGFSEMIIQTPALYGDSVPHALLADIEVVHRNSQHLSSLIDDVLDLSQVEAGRMALRKEPSAMSEIVQEAIGTVGAAFHSKGLSLEVVAPDSLPRLLCDPTRIRQVLLNLLSNAVRFTEKGGVTVRAWQEKAASTRHRDRIIVSVADTGPGIDPRNAERVFEPFRQADEASSKSRGGSGLGLAISKRFIEMHQGKMWLESEVGAGTTIFFSLPTRMPDRQTATMTRWFNPHLPYDARSRRSLSPSPVVRPRLAVFDQEGELPRLLTRYLDGTDIVAFDQLEKAVEEVKHSPVQALIVNSPLAGDLLSPLSAFTELPYRTPVLVCRMPGKQEVAQRLCVLDYLVKPVSRSALLGCLEGLGKEVKSVLLVDDEPEALQLFARILASSEHGYQVLRATNGQQALDLLQSRRPDIMFLDLMMPGMDGFQLLEAKAKDEMLRDIPTVVISARDPMSEPLVSNALTVTRSGGLSVGEVLSCIQGISGILTPVHVRDHQVSQ